MTRVHRLLIALGLLQLGDLLSTYAALALGGHEGNPLMQGVISSPWAAVALKLMLVVLIAGLALYADPKVARRWLTLAVVFYAVAVTSNLDRKSVV